MKRLIGNVNLMAGLGLLSLILVLFVLSYLLPESNAYDISATGRLLSPSWQHLFGTDNLGRDIFMRVAIASRSALTIGFCSVVFGGSCGVLLGLIAGWFGGWLDLVLVRLLDAMKAIPSLLLALMIVTMFGSSLEITIAVVSILAIPLYARMARTGARQQKTQDYIQWTRLIGIGAWRTLFRHVLPNMLPPIIVTASLGFANAVLTEASLSYLGLGVQPPEPSWGKMLADSQSYLLSAPWIALANGAMLTLLVLGFNLLGDGLQQYYENESIDV